MVRKTLSIFQWYDDYPLVHNLVGWFAELWHYLNTAVLFLLNLFLVGLNQSTPVDLACSVLLYRSCRIESNPLDPDIGDYPFRCEDCPSWLGFGWALDFLLWQADVNLDISDSILNLSGPLETWVLLWEQLHGWEKPLIVIVRRNSWLRVQSWDDTERTVNINWNYQKHHIRHHTLCTIWTCIES